MTAVKAPNLGPFKLAAKQEAVMSITSNLAVFGGQSHERKALTSVVTDNVRKPARLPLLLAR